MTAIISDATNSKLGRLIHSWSIPAGETCPGLSGLCAGCCYAKKGFFRMPNVARSHQRNWDFSQTEGFVPWMTASIRATFVRIMRVHVAGDYYDIPYIRKWLEIVKQSRNTTFFAYTRSWRQEEMLPELIRLGAERNFVLWWSMDRETGPAPIVRGVRRGYMAIDDADAETAPDDCDLVFRDQPRTVMKKANGMLVCPPENGVTGHRVTCSNCGICWDKKRVPAWQPAMSDYFTEGTEILAPAA